MLAPPMCLDLRHSFEGIILGFASGRKRERRSTISLKAITDCPQVSALSLRVRLDPDRERRSLIGHDWEYGAWQFSAKFCHEKLCPSRQAAAIGPTSRPSTPRRLPAAGNLRLRVNAKDVAARGAPVWLLTLTPCPKPCRSRVKFEAGGRRGSRCRRFNLPES
jgi:hypothetical protein